MRVSPIVISFMRISWRFCQFIIMSCSEGKCPLSDASVLEEKLKPYEEYVDQIQAMVFWRNPIPMAIFVVCVELLFIFIGTLHLSFLPCLFLFLALKTLIRFVIQAFGQKIHELFFKPVENKGEGAYPIYPLDTFCQTVTCFTSKLVVVIKAVKPQGELTIASSIIPLGVLFACFLVFWLTGTFWLAFILVNLVIFLPAILLHPAVKPKVTEVVRKLQKQKTE